VVAFNQGQTIFNFPIVFRSTGFFVFLYAMFYYFKRSNMSGALQTIEFFGYTALTCYVFFLMLGTVSFFASLNFVKYIYVNYITLNTDMFKNLHFLTIMYQSIFKLT
jgi:hypothetical protein